MDLGRGPDLLGADVCFCFFFYIFLLFLLRVLATPSAFQSTLNFLILILSYSTVS